MKVTGEAFSDAMFSDPVKVLLRTLSRSVSDILTVYVALVEDDFTSCSVGCMNGWRGA